MHEPCNLKCAGGGDNYDSTSIRLQSTVLRPYSTTFVTTEGTAAIGQRPLSNPVTNVTS